MVDAHMLFVATAGNDTVGILDSAPADTLLKVEIVIVVKGWSLASGMIMGWGQT